MNRPAEAEEIVRESLEICGRIYQPNHQQIGFATHTLGRSLRAQNRHAEACEQFAKSVAIVRSAFDDSHGFVATARMDLGIELMELGRYAEAEPELLAACEALDAAGKVGASTVECTRAIVRLYEAWDEAAIGRNRDKELLRSMSRS